MGRGLRGLIMLSFPSLCAQVFEVEVLPGMLAAPREYHSIVLSLISCSGLRPGTAEWLDPELCVKTSWLPTKMETHVAGVRFRFVCPRRSCAGDIRPGNRDVLCIRRWGAIRGQMLSNQGSP